MSAAASASAPAAAGGAPGASASDAPSTPRNGNGNGNGNGKGFSSGDESDLPPLTPYPVVSSIAAIPKDHAKGVEPEVISPYIDMHLS